MTRDEHIEWCKKRALEYIENGNALNALTSMYSDLGKHEETEDHPGIKIGVMLQMCGSLQDLDEAKHFIESFR